MFAAVRGWPVVFAMAFEVGKLISSHHLLDDHLWQLPNLFGEALDLKLEEGELTEDVCGFKMAKLLHHSSFLFLLSVAKFFLATKLLLAIRLFQLLVTRWFFTGSKLSLVFHLVLDGGQRVSKSEHFIINKRC